VQRTGTRFVVQSRNGTKGDCETFYFSGANANYMVRGAPGPAGPAARPPPGGAGARR
jgi:hypothetical protein